MSTQPAPEIAPSNAEQFEAWDGSGGEFWADWATRFNEGVAEHHRIFMDAAAVGAADQVLDIGCGSGETTLDAARQASDGAVLGVDLSTRMLAVARERAVAEGLDNVSFIQADAQIHPFPGHHDLVISRSGSMFFGDPPAAFANIAHALRPGGRMVLMAWQTLANNEWASSFRTALSGGRELPVPVVGTPGPFSGLSEPDYVRDLLSGAGMSDIELADIRRSMYYGRTVDDACAFVSSHMKRMLAELDAEQREVALDKLRTNMAEHLTESGVRYDSAVWLITARR